MKRNLLYITLMTTSLWAMTACSDDSSVQETNTVRTPIELNVGIADKGMSRAAVVTDCDDNTQKRAFTKETKLRLVLQSDNDNATPSTTHMHTVTMATAASVTETEKTDGVPNDGTTSAVTMTPYRYWDDAYARDAAVSIYALAVADNNDATSKFANTKWAEATPESTAGKTETAWINGEVSNTDTGTSPTVKGTNITWTIGKTSNGKQIQDDNTIMDDNLCFSNNIVDYRNAGTDRRLKYNNTATKKFDKGNLIFFHALSKITIQVFAGEGFITDDNKVADSFAFTSGNIKMKGFNGAGTFDVKEGKFVSDITQTDFESISCSAPSRSDCTKSVYTLTAYVVPGTNINPNTDIADALSFVIYNNEYTVSMKKLYEAIKANTENVEGSAVKSFILDDGTNLKAGVHYNFSFTIAKSKIKGIEAQIVDWETVDAINIVPSNAKVKLDLEKRGGGLNCDLNLYRFAETSSAVTSDITSEDGKGYNWSASAYEGPNLYDYDNTSNKMQTTWYWPNNVTFYHFRAVSPTSLTKGTADNKDNIPLTAGTTYTDVLWGAPFKEMDGSAEAANNAKISYSTTKGFDGKGAEGTNPTHQIYPAIGATEDVVHLLLFHMMSDVSIKIQTVEGEEKITLTDGTSYPTIQFKNLYTTGIADMGCGVVNTTGSTSNPLFAMSSLEWNNYGAIPQDLTNVVLVITTPDKNEYEVDLKDVLVAETGAISTNNIANPYTLVNQTDGTKRYRIDRWYPGYKYTYIVTLKKKGISDIQATILDWEKVEASQDDIQIK